MTISVCMIVKNEEDILARCLDSIVDLANEIIIVDTGSMDRTKEIALGYTKKVYDFVWTGSFSDARNYAFSKATMEYIYSADADEVLDEENREKFRVLKETLLPEIEIVQMRYGNQLSFGTVYNFDEELRPKLFKRLRSFQWIEPIHETICIDPIIYDSDIVITHLPKNNHASRDFMAFRRVIDSGEGLSKRLHNMYAKELFIAGEEQDFLNARAFFETSLSETKRGLDEIKEAACVVAKAALIEQDIPTFYKSAMKVVALDGCSEVCTLLGQYYQKLGDLDEAIIWFYNGAYETQPILAIAYGRELPLKGLVQCYQTLGMVEQAEIYQSELEERKKSQ